MDYRQLSHQACRDAGLAALIPQIASVATASGRAATLVGAVRDAWIDIQNERQDWMWMRLRFSKALTINQKVYTKTDLGLARLARFLPDALGHRTMTLYDTALGQEDEGEIEFISYERWIEMYDRGTHEANRPRHWSYSPQRELVIGPKPDKAYTLRGAYRATAQVLEDDGDEPECPEDFHRLIAQEAVRLSHRQDEALQLLPEAANQYSRLRNALVIDQTPQASM